MDQQQGTIEIPVEEYKMLLLLAQLAIDEASFITNSERKQRIWTLASELQKERDYGLNLYGNEQ